MRKTVVTVIALASILVITGFVVVLVNQTAQVVMLAERVHPAAASALFWALMALYTFCVLVPVYLIIRLPKPLDPPESRDDPEFEKHLARLRGRLRTNQYLVGESLDSVGEIEAALARLDLVANERIKAAGSQVFITTAISQNGSLDSFLVLAAQSKLVLEVARVYYQRPSLREMLSLYANVAATAFVAGELEDLDISEQLEPVIAAAFGSAAGAIPGFGAASNLFVSSVMGGAANAFLTLRVGAISRQYSRALTEAPRRSIRRVAVVEATQMLGSVAAEGTRRVAKAMGEAARDTLGGAFESIGGQIRNMGTGVRDRTSMFTEPFRRRRDDPPGGGGTAP